MQNSQKLRIAIVDDHSLLRAGLRRLLSAEPNFELIGEASDGAEAIALVREYAPDVLVLDLAMPGVSGLDVLRVLNKSKEFSHVLIVILTASITEQTIQECFKLGVRGIVLKRMSSSILVRCISTVSKGGYWLGDEPIDNPAAIPPDLVESIGENSNAGAYGLTPREREVLAAAVSGETNRDIARKLKLSEQTVKHHLTNIFDKLGVYNRLELTLFAVHHGLVNKTEAAEAAAHGNNI